ncbi:hypothetical protein, partial [Mycobacterium tuberculosis]
RNGASEEAGNLAGPGDGERRNGASEEAGNLAGPGDGERRNGASEEAGSHAQRDPINLHSACGPI